jgi:hypothetical protein
MAKRGRKGKRRKHPSPFRVNGNFTLVVMDSVPWTSFKKAKVPFLRKHSKELRPGFATSTWTRPSMLSMVLCGMMPSQNDKEQAHDYIKRMMVPTVPVQAQLAGYFTAGVITIPLILDGKGFHKFVTLPAYRETATKALQAVKKFHINQKQPFFLLVHLSETHMAYNCEGKKKTNYKEGADIYNTDNNNWSDEYLEYLRSEQIKCLEFLDGRIKELYKMLPPTNMIVTADHGDLFGEKHRFGHGYWFHRNLFEVPFCYIKPKGG